MQCSFFYLYIFKVFFFLNPYSQNLLIIFLENYSNSDCVFVLHESSRSYCLFLTVQTYLFFIDICRLITLQHHSAGMFMEVDFPSSGSNYTANLISPLETETNDKCLTFWYYGSGEGNLIILSEEFFIYSFIPLEKKEVSLKSYLDFSY